MNPGIYHDIPFAEYLAIDAMSQSVLKEGRKSMLHLQAAQQQTTKPTDAMLLGSAVHCAFLEPELVPQRVVLWDGGTRRGKAWDAFQQEHSGKLILTETMYEHFQGMLKSLRRHPEITKWNARPGPVEVTGIREVRGVLCKSRADKLTDDPVVDLKTCADGDPRLFRRRAYDLGYHIQAWLYCQVFERERFILMTVESQPPYDVVPYEMTFDMMDLGRREACDLLDRYRECCDSGRFPGRSDEALMIDLPAYLEDTNEHLIVGGESIAI